MYSKYNLNQFNTAIFCDCVKRLWGPALSRSCIMNEVRSVSVPLKAVGPAYTMRISIDRNPDGKNRERFLRTYDEAPSGAVIVIQVVGNVGGAVIGDVAAHRLVKRQVAGVVIDGPARDLEGLVQQGLPVWARDVTMLGMTPDDVVTEVSIEVVCGGTLVRPDDLVVADLDGVFVVPKEKITKVLDLVQIFSESELKTHEALSKGMLLHESYKSKDNMPLDEKNDMERR